MDSAYIAKRFSRCRKKENEILPRLLLKLNWANKKVILNAERFIQKLPGMILVSAFSEMRGDVEWFKFDRARLLKDTSPEIIRNQILEDNILVDLRLHDKGTSARNHGTGFRAREDKLPLLFKKVRDL